MDLSFTLSLRDEGRAPKWAASLADIKAAAEARRPKNADRTAADVLRGQAGKLDLVHILACVIVSQRGEANETVALQGSFNPVVARQLMVGEHSEDGVYLHALADVQG